MEIGEHVRTDTGWEVVDTHPVDDRGVTIGSNFTVGNGYLGYRGTRPDQRADSFVGCVVSDTYDMADGVWRELATVPNGLLVTLAADGRPLTFDADQDAEVELTLQTGEYTHRAMWSNGSVEALVSVRRFASLDDLHVVMQQVTVVATHEMTLQVHAGIDPVVWSLNGDHLGRISTTREDGLATARCTTNESRVDIAVASSWRISRDSLHLWPGDDVTITSAMAVATSNDDDVPFGPLERAFDSAETAIENGYRDTLERSARHWTKFWDTADVVISGDDTMGAQAALRFSIWHNRIATPAHNDRLPIGARGLSCQAYQGAAFWDQEMFNLPAYLFTAPDLARNILTYRWRTLDGARRKAARLGYEGAFFAWISGTTGDELCPDFFFDDVLTGRPIRNHFNDWQMHISPDIAVAVERYWDAAGDDEFMVEHGAEIVFEVANFLASFVKYVPHRERYEIIRLLGPDEWHENVDNDAYTNRMTQIALAAAVRVRDWMSEHHPDRLAGLDAGDDRAARWSDVHDRLHVPAPDPDTSIIEQFDGFFALEDTQPGQLRERLLEPDEYWGWPNGVAVHTQVSKQPAVVQLFAVDPTHPLDVQRANFEYYEPRCAHGSSLSHSVHATVAARLAADDPALMSQALAYFWLAATLDLNDVHPPSVGGTFIGGMHTAANAGAYQTAVYGFGGVSIEAGRLRVAPVLPPGWTSLTFALVVRGQRLDVTASHDGHVVTSRPVNDETVTLVVGDEPPADLEPGGALRW
ncbi:glycosyl hydrolase family 65 protein [Ilumatobacter nonamiensis]|uniref:glycosyl hydrolase family 65 protein n=1 Tax=Ilumatobacter nonamiensis TaxID=467093 RepID=UPI000347243C|nr:glycosyl hydrolase family 65 protein [Ilumatobacter nonamiensis]